MLLFYVCTDKGTFVIFSGGIKQAQGIICEICLSPVWVKQCTGISGEVKSWKTGFNSGYVKQCTDVKVWPMVFLFFLIYVHLIETVKTKVDR